MVHMCPPNIERLRTAAKPRLVCQVPVNIECDMESLWASDPSALPPPSSRIPSTGLTASNGVGLEDPEQDAVTTATALEQLRVDSGYLEEQVPHKSIVGLFATSSAIEELMRGAGLLGDRSLFGKNIPRARNIKRNL